MLLNPIWIIIMRELFDRKVFKYYLLIFSMRTINETFTDEEHKKLIKMKKKLSWHDFILLMYTHCLDSERKGNFEVGINFDSWKHKPYRRTYTHDNIKKEVTRTCQN